MIPLTSLLALLLATADSVSLFHAPHDSVYSLASANLPSGEVITVATGTESVVLFTKDNGLTWSMLAGAGLELETPWEITYHSGLPATGGSGLFLIGTERGIWTWDPVADVVATLHTGLGVSDRHILDLESPLPGANGPVIALTVQGGVYLLSASNMTWQTVLNTGPVYARRGAVALTPNYDAASGAARKRDLYVTASGKLWMSRNGGANWTLHPSFNTTANSINDWMIAVIALSSDYATDGIAMLGRVRFDTAAASDHGEILRSGNGGTSFTQVRQLGSGIQSLICTPPGPTGVRSWMAAARAYPGTGSYAGTGVLVSSDTGFTWSDFGNDQDFLLEDNPGKLSGYEPLNFEQQLVAVADYGTRGAVMYGRQEGLFLSADEGRHWVQVQMRVEREFRDLDTSWTSDGYRAVFGAGYGVGTMLHVPLLNYVNELQIEPQMIYQRRLDVSPNFVQDGNVIAAGNVTLWCWQSDRVPNANPFNKTFWWQPANRDPFSGDKLTGFPRIVSYSPNFDGRGVPGKDQTYFWCGWDFGPLRSEDNGKTALPLQQLSTGGVAGEMTCFAIAPTYDAFGARTDAYCADQGGRVFRLVNEKWLKLVDLGPLVEDMIIAPNWSRPANPVIYAALAGWPYVAEVRDTPGGLVVNPLSAGLSEVAANGLAADPNFATTPVLYLSTLGSGVWKLDLSAPSPTWTQFGAGFPRMWARDVALSADFANDHLVYAATQNGIWECPDALGGTWRLITNRGTRDDVDESMMYYQPTDPSNPEFDNAWPWTDVKAWNLPPNLPIFGESIQTTTFNTSFVSTFAKCSYLEVLTMAGPTMGSVLVRAVDPVTEVLINAVTVDLATVGGGTNTPYRVPLNIPGFRSIKVYVSAQLDPGEMLVFDAIEFRD